MPEPRSAEGAALLADGRALDAVEVLRHAVAAGEPSAPDLLARAYLDSGSWDAAAEWFGTLVEEGHLHFAGRLGVALAALGDFAAAEDALRLAVEHGDLASVNDLAILLRDGDRLEEAAQLLRWAVRQGDPQAAANLVVLYLEADDLPAAAVAAEQYADEARPDTLVALADVRVLQDRGAEAERLYVRAGELDALRAHSAYGQFLLDTRDDAQGAEREFREAARHGEPGWAYTLGRFLLDEGRPDEARNHLLTAADAGDPDAAAALAELDGMDQDAI